ncbi:MAG: cell division protein FtsA, partial [Pseudomonadota bacterium]
MKLIKRHNKRTKPPEGGDLISTLDLGAAKYSCSIARLSETGDGFEPDVLGVGQVEAPKKSTVSDREQAIRGAIDSAERMAGETISEVALLVSGRYLTSTRVAVDLELPRGIVTEEDVTECFWEAAGSGTDGRMPLSLTPIQYRVGGDIEREPPIGFQATELSVEALLIDARSTPVENIKQLVENCGVDVA